MVRYKIPHLKTEYEGASRVIASSSKANLKGRQSQRAGLLSVPQITSSDSVFVFAGSTGLAASRLEYRRMLFTDADRRRVMIAERAFQRAKLTRARFKDDNILRTEAKGYDWVFSFEPYFIQESNLIVPKLLSIPRKGIVLVHDSALDYLKETFAEAYGTPVEDVPSRQVKGDDGKEETVPGYFIARTTPEILEKACTDLRIVEALNRARHTDTGALEDIREKIGLSIPDFRASLERLDRCYLPGPYIKKRQALEVSYDL